MRLWVRKPMKIVHEPGWTAWSLEVFGEPFMVWHDGPDFSELRRRWADDPLVVTRMVRLGLRTTDPMAARAAADLASIGAAGDLEPDLRDRLTSSTGNLQTQIARALAISTGSSVWSKPILRNLHRLPSSFDRMDAAIALAYCPASPAVVTALRRAATKDREYLVRYHAERSLRAHAP